MFSVRFAALLSIASLGLAAAACSSSSSSDSSSSTGGQSSSSSSKTSSASTSSSASTGGSGASGTGAGGSGGGGGGPMCMGPGFGGGSNMKIVAGAVTATIVDQNNAPVVGQPIFICGTDLCSKPGMTDANGNASITTTDPETKPAFKFGDSINYAEFGIPLTTMDADLMTIMTAKFPAAGAMMSPGTTATSGDVTLTIPKGCDVEVNSLVYTTAAEQKFRTQAIPVDMAAQVLASSMQSFDLLYAAAPAATTFCPAAKVSVANSMQWPAGTKVEFWVTTIETSEDYAPYAGWAKESDGAVSADGKTIDTVDGQGFQYLDNFAILKK